MFWTSGDSCPGFQNPGGSLACMLSRLRFTSWWPARQQSLSYTRSRRSNFPIAILFPKIGTFKFLMVYFIKINSSYTDAMGSCKKKMVGFEYYGRSTKGTFVDTRTHFKPKLHPLWWMSVIGPGASSDENKQKDNGNCNITQQLFSFIILLVHRLFQTSLKCCVNWEFY